MRVYFRCFSHHGDISRILNPHPGGKLSVALKYDCMREMYRWRATRAIERDLSRCKLGYTLKPGK